MSEPRFITKNELGEGTVVSTDDLYYTIEKLFLAVETASEILTHMAELNKDEKEIERENWKTKGADLAYLRNQHDMTIVDMARLLDCTCARIFDAEQGTIDPTDLQRLAVEKLMKL